MSSSTALTASVWGKVRSCKRGARNRDGGILLAVAWPRAILCFRACTPLEALTRLHACTPTRTHIHTGQAGPDDKPAPAPGRGGVLCCAHARKPVQEGGDAFKSAHGSTLQPSLLSWACVENLRANNIYRLAACSAAHLPTCLHLVVPVTEHMQSNQGVTCPLCRGFIECYEPVNRPSHAGHQVILRGASCKAFAPA
eukprot:1154043-Pelagomonas_calceolata.AAC.3